MDDFVRNKLIEWDLEKWMDKFEDEEITEESFYELNDEFIDKLIPKVGPGLKFKKRFKQLKEEQNIDQETVHFSAQEQEDASDLDQVLPSTSDQGKRKSDHQDKSSEQQPPAKRRRSSKLRPLSETVILSDVKNIMRHVQARLHGQDKLNVFLRDKIKDLETDKRELVGVFGKTGAGKSSLINAIINKEGLLPSGSVSACTSVIIKVEASKNSMYEADIEFIKKEDWENEVQSLKQFMEDEDEDDDKRDDYHDPDGKLSALYGEEWKEKSTSSLMNNKYFSDVPEFLDSQKKTFKSNSAKGLAKQYVEYTRSDSNKGERKKGKRWYWPLVKCVTVRVPDNDFLQHVTLVDLPGNGDRNSSRDKMWTEFVSQCSVVWIVTEINRAASEKEAWDILEGASSLMGNSGQCQQIHFICTKSDHQTSDTIKDAKATVRKIFNKQKTIENHFSDDCFKVFTVSSKEFLKGKNSNPDGNEIPKLQEVLKNLNNTHSETLNYVSGAYGILSLIQGAKSREVVDKKNDVCEILEGKLCIQLNQVKKAIENATETFEQCLSEGVERSSNSCKKKLKSFLHPNKPSGFHGTLKAVVRNDGIYKPRKGKPKNLNMKLASCLTESIDKEFRKTFPNNAKCGTFNGAIDAFSLGTNSLIQKYKDVELQLRFLGTEEQKMKAKLNRIIRTEKKSIYSSLTDTIKNNMKECYKEAAAVKGNGTLKNIRDIIERHVSSKNEMFEEAKIAMLDQLNDLKEKILKTLKSMEESIELSLKTESYPLPDISEQLETVEKYYNELKDGSDEETSP